MIKDIWAQVSYYWFIIMLAIVGFFVGGLEVDALELKAWSYSKSQIAEDIAGDITFGSWYDTPHNFYPSYPVERIRYILKASDGLSRENSYNFTWGYQPNPDTLGIKYVKYWKNGQDDITSSFTCGQFYRNDYGYYLTDCSFAPPSDFSSSDELWITIGFYEDYVTSLRTYVYGYDERLGTNAVITNQTNNIINNQNNNTSSIINNNNQNTQSIINNQNNNTQAQIDSQMVCTNIDKNSIYSVSSYLTQYGNLEGYSGAPTGVTDYYKITEKDKLSMVLSLPSSVNSNYYFCFYNSNKTYISCNSSRLSVLGDIPIPSEAFYVRFTISNDLNLPQFKICKNGNQALQDTIDNDNVDDPSGFISDFEDLLPQNGVITNLIGLPITLYTKVLNSINGTCSQFNLGTLYNTALIIPCIDIDDYLGSNIWNTIDLIISGGFVLIMARKMIKAFQNFTSMKEGDVLGD